MNKTLAAKIANYLGKRAMNDAQGRKIAAGAKPLPKELKQEK